MLPRKPTSLVRPNVPNAVRTKRRLSRDYNTPTKDLGSKGFGMLAKTAKRKSIINLSSGPRPSPTLLHAKALAAFSHFVIHGDHTSMAKLVLSGRNDRGRALIVAWFERVSQLHWDKIDRRFRGKPDRTRLSVEAAARIPVAQSSAPKSAGAATVDYSRSTFPRIKCSVCERPAMPGEDTCYSHHSG
jgi:hypothetical protein